MAERSKARVTVLIPSYDRPNMLKYTLPFWLSSYQIRKVIVMAEASTIHKAGLYEDVLGKYSATYGKKLFYEVSVGRSGSVKSRNRLLSLALKLTESEFILLADDDYILPKESKISVALNYFRIKDVGAVGGRVVMLGKRTIDPDFFLNLPMNLADILTDITGYIFLDVSHGPRIAKYLPPFFIIRRELIKYGLMYDVRFDTPTSFREESDFQRQIGELGYKLVFDPRIYVYHIAVEEGGNRKLIDPGKRFYWKARNHTVFLMKWNKSLLKKIIYQLFLVFLLGTYRPQYLGHVLKGIKDAMHLGNV